MTSASTGSLNADYTTSKLFIDEQAAESVPVTIAFSTGALDTVEAEVCFKRLDGTASCGRESNLAPGESHDFWGCQLTSTYKYLGCEHWKTRKESCSMMRANGPFIDD